MKSKLTQKERQKIKYFFYTCKLKYLISSNICRIIKTIVNIGIFMNLTNIQFTSLISVIVAIVFFSFMYAGAILIMKLYLLIASKRYDSLEINRINHKISGSFVKKESSEIISSYKSDFKKIQNDYIGKSVKTTTHTIIIINFIKALAPENKATDQICYDIINASKNPDSSFSKMYSFPGHYEITINRSTKGKQRNGVAHNPLRIIKYMNIPFSKMTDKELIDLYKEDTFYNLCINFH